MWGTLTDAQVAPLPGFSHTSQPLTGEVSCQVSLCTFRGYATPEVVVFAWVT